MTCPIMYHIAYPSIKFGKCTTILRACKQSSATRFVCSLDPPSAIQTSGLIPKLTSSNGNLRCNRSMKKLGSAGPSAGNGGNHGHTEFHTTPLVCLRGAAAGSGYTSDPFSTFQEPEDGYASRAASVSMMCARTQRFSSFMDNYRGPTMTITMISLMARTATMTTMIMKTIMKTTTIAKINMAMSAAA